MWTTVEPKSASLGASLRALHAWLSAQYSTREQSITNEINQNEMFFSFTQVLDAIDMRSLFHSTVEPNPAATVVYEQYQIQERLSRLEKLL